MRSFHFPFSKYSWDWVLINGGARGRWLERHPKVAWVSYLGLPTHESHADALRLLRVRRAFGGMLTFGVRGDAQVGSEVVNKLKLASNLANVGTSFSILYSADNGVLMDVLRQGTRRRW